MNTRKTEKTTNSRLFNKGILPVAVATAMFGSSSALAATLVSEATTVTASSTTSYTIEGNEILTLSGGADMSTTGSSFNGTIDGNTVGFDNNGLGSYLTGQGNVTIAGNITMSGNIGATNKTSLFTLNDGNTLELSDNMNTFNTSNVTMQENTILNLGNSTLGFNIGQSNALSVFSNISMAGNSTINVGNSTIVGNIYGSGNGKGTLNVVGNFTAQAGLGIGVILDINGSIAGNATQDSANVALAQINISEGNTFTLNTNATATNMDINGTVTATGNITASVTLGANGILTLNTENTYDDNAPKVVGTIQSGTIDQNYGTLNINGTFTTQGAIGQGGRGLAAINLSNSTNFATGFTTTFAHSVNATTITIGTSNSQTNSTLAVSTSDITITGNIAGGGNYTSGGNIASGILDINANAIVDGTIGTSGAYLAEVQVANDMILTAKGSIYSGNITFETQTSSANATLALNGTSGTSYDIKANITPNNGGGLIDINSGNWTFDSEIANKDNRIAAIRIENGAWANFSNSISANETVTVNGTMNIAGSLSITALDTSGNGRGLMIGGGLTNGSTNATLQISDDAVLTIGSKVAAGTAQGDGATFENATIRLNGAGTTSYNSNSTAAIDMGTNNQTVELNGVTLDLIGNSNSNNTYSDGQVINIIGRGSTAGNNGTLTVTGSVNVLDSSAMLSFSENSANFITGSGSNNQTGDSALQVTVNYVSAGTLGLTGNTQTTYDGAKTAISRDNVIFNALSSMSTNAQVDAAIATLHPATGGAAAASASISGSSMSAASTRMAYTRQVGLGKGMNAGSATLDESMWVQIFGADVDQDNVGGVSGYDADGQGLAIGIDGMSEDGTTRIGIAGSFANTDVSGKDSTTRTTTDIDTTQVMAYANKVNDDGSYLEGTASFAFNDNTGTRRILVGAVDRTASSAYDSTTFAVNVEAGWPQENDGTTITPTLGLAYSHLSADAYTETGAAGMNLNVTPSDYDTFEGKVGVKITGKSVDADGGIGRPEVRIGVTHNFGDDTADSTATFTAGGTSFTTTGVETDSTKVDLGLGYTYTTPEGDTDISVNIDGRSSSSYLQYGGGLTVKWKF